MKNFDCRYYYIYIALKKYQMKNIIDDIIIYILRSQNFK